MKKLLEQWKNDILKPYISDQDFCSSNVGVVDVGCSLHMFNIRYKQIFTASQPTKLELDFDGLVPNEVNGYVLVLKKK